MPQQHLDLDQTPPEAALLLEVADLTLDLLDEVRITVRLKRQDEDPVTFRVIRLRGAEADYLSTALQSISHAWLYGTRNDVLRAIQAVEREARRHGEKHERSGA